MAQHEIFVDINHYRLTHGPIMVSFDTTQLCNLRCVHCFNNSGDQAPNPDLPREQRLDIARQIAEMHPFNVCMCGGESLCCSDLFDIMDVLRPHVGKLSMVSNGFLMTSEMARRLVEHGLDLAQISIDGANAWQHDSFRGVQGSFDRAVAAVRNLIAAGISSVDVSMVPNRLNWQSLEEYTELCHDLGVHQIRLMPFLPSGRGRSVGRNLMLDEKQYFQFCRSLERLDARYQGRPAFQWGDPIDHMRRMPFNANLGLHSYSMEIKANADLTLSTYLPVLVGNCTRRTLREYWDGGYKNLWGNEQLTRYTDQIRNIYDLENFEPAPYSGETIMIDILEA